MGNWIPPFEPGGIQFLSASSKDLTQRLRLGFDANDLRLHPRAVGDSLSLPGGDQLLLANDVGGSPPIGGTKSFHDAGHDLELT
jgi:hypothetical protein